MLSRLGGCRFANDSRSATVSLLTESTSCESASLGVDSTSTVDGRMQLTRSQNSIRSQCPRRQRLSAILHMASMKLGDIDNFPRRIRNSPTMDTKNTGRLIVSVKH